MRDESIRETLEDLTREEARLAIADGELARAKARYQVASRRYAAVRDVAEEMLGQNPYHPDTYMKVWGRLDEMPPDWGNFRYLGKGVGDAVLDFLRDRGGYWTLREIVQHLSYGGLSTNARAVNASLLKMKGVTKDGEHYQFGDSVKEIQDES
jgi:hypothetical protein